MSGGIKKTVLLLLVVAVVGISIAWYSSRSQASTLSYRTAEVKRGDLQATITATGTIEPVESIDVGARVSGEIKAFGKDKDGKEVDHCSIVEEGAILAQIDDAVYVAQMDQANATLKQAEASLEKSKAELKQLEAKSYQAERDWQRAQKLGPSEALAQSSFDAYQSAYEIAKANLDVGKAAIQQAEAAVAQARANLVVAKRNLGYCTIVSPANGVIIDRRVNIGQTVAASLNTPSLFLIAKDLTRMEIWVSVSEASIGSIRPGQPVTFKVNAFPDRLFKGEVNKVRLNASMTQNVVNYVVEVNTDNSDGTLLPYLTADVTFETECRKEILKVQNAAIRWSPVIDQVAPEYRDAELVKLVLQTETAAPGAPGAAAAAVAKAAAQKQDIPNVIWIAEGEFVKPLVVKTGLTDGIATEIQPLPGGMDPAECKEGLLVVTGEQVVTADDGNNNTTNPFTPQFRRRR